MSERRRIGIFGWGVVAPRSRNIEAFTENLASSESWLSAFDGYGPSNFLVGKPDFDLTDYAGWISERFPPARFKQIDQKMGTPTKYAIGAFVQSLSQNPGIEQYLQELGPLAHVYVGTGLGDLPTFYDESVRLHHALEEWSAFWANPERNEALREHLDGGGSFTPPADPQTLSSDERAAAQMEWNSYWTDESRELQRYLEEIREIEGMSVEGDVEKGKGALLRRKQARTRELRERWGCPIEPWNQVSANVLWNIHSTPASQISMLGKITGMTFAPVAACSTFGYALKLAKSAIETGEATAVVVGATDPVPHGISVGSFYAARVIAADGVVSKPLTGLRGTHISGGSTVWIIGDYDVLTAKGFQPLGMEPVGIGVTADADHIITPTPEGPTAAIQRAFTDAAAEPKELTSWDLHATATPGDYLEVETARKICGENVLFTARKGTFGHGMGVCGGWELLAQYLGYTHGTIYPTPLQRDDLNPIIGNVHDRFAYLEGIPAEPGLAGKLSMGVGGINVCVLSRPW